MRYFVGGILGGVAGALAAGYVKPTQSNMTLVIIAVGLLIGLLVAWATAPDKPLPYEEDLRSGGKTNVTAFAMRIGQPEAKARAALNAMVNAGVAEIKDGHYQINPKRR